jgi:hypothetical protein
VEVVVACINALFRNLRGGLGKYHNEKKSILGKGKKKKVKQSHYSPGHALRLPDFKTVGT